MWHYVDTITTVRDYIYTPAYLYIKVHTYFVNVGFYYKCCMSMVTDVCLTEI